MAEWTVDPNGIETVYVEGAIVEHKVGEEASQIIVIVPNKRADWREAKRRGTFMLRPKNRRSQSSGRGNVTNVISGGTHIGTVIQAGDVHGNLHIGPDSVSGLSDQLPLKVTITTPPGIEVDYES